MAQSKLDPNIYYPELRKLDEEDKDMDASLFQIEIDDQDVIIALGEPKYTFIENNIVYFPVYNIKNDLVEGQIGIYEIMSDKASFIYDDDGDIDVAELGPILLYSFVTPTYLVEQNEDAEVIEVDNEDEEEGEDSELVEVDIDDIIEKQDTEEDEESEKDKGDEDLENKIEKNIENEIITKKQEKEQAEKERKAYKKSKDEDWVQTFMRNNNYTIIENEGGGDCLFAVIRDAFEQIGKYTTIARLRDIVAEETTHEIFQENLKVYLDIENAINNYEKAIQFNQKHLHAYNNLGLIFYDLGEYVKAIYNFKEAVSPKITKFVVA